ncbi:hypothetical protein KY312_00735, partial [Candidatus Woesearchaeota archaeon]|nr:hypothetical protein [Candidatus Woesearchaeota archaeon]
MKTYNRLSFLKRIVRFLGIGVLCASLYGCQTEKTEDFFRQRKNSLELGFGYTHQESKTNLSQSTNFRLRNRDSPGEKRWNLDMRVNDNSDAEDVEGIVSGDFYLNNKNKQGGGLNFKAGNKQLEAGAAGHFTAGNTRVSARVFGGKRTDKNSVDDLVSETENIYIGGVADAKIKLDKHNHIALGATYNKSEFSYETAGLSGNIPIEVT